MNEYHRLSTDIAASHRTGIGSSDIPTLAGLTERYGTTPLSLWRVKTGRDPAWTGNEATWWGHVHEQAVLYRWVRDAFGSERAAEFRREALAGEARYPLAIMTEARHPQYAFALAHADLLVTRDNLDEHGLVAENLGHTIVEAKSHGLRAAERGEDPDFGYSPDDRSHNGLPASVFLQVQWQLYVYGVPEAEIAVLINTNDYRTYGPVRADRRVQEQSLALAERFWWHVEHDKPPQPVTWSDICSLFPVPRQTTAMVSGDQELLARKLVERKRRLAKLEAKIKAEQDDVRNALGLLIGENAVLGTADGETLARSYGRSRETVDIAALRKLPELHQAVKAANLIKRAEWREVR